MLKGRSLLRKKRTTLLYAQLTNLDLENLGHDAVHVAEAAALYIFIGARPYTEWFSDLLMTHDRRRVVTGHDPSAHAAFKTGWKLES